MGGRGTGEFEEEGVLSIVSHDIADKVNNDDECKGAHCQTLKTKQ